MKKMNTSPLFHLILAVLSCSYAVMKCHKVAESNKLRHFTEEPPLYRSLLFVPLALLLGLYHGKKGITLMFSEKTPREENL